MRNKDKAIFAELEKQLIQFSNEKFKLLGINSSARRDAFVMQLIDSIRRVNYIFTVVDRDNISKNRADPTSNSFDPLLASILFRRKGMVDESFWLAFLAIHFGKSSRTGWRLARDIYGALGSNDHWTWERTISNLGELKKWLASYYLLLKNDGVPRRFGNHRKYETLNPNSPQGPFSVIESYIKWVDPLRGHEMLIQDAGDKENGDSRAMFNSLYRSMNSVSSFGRTGKFDYLTMIAKLGLASIEPGKTYMQGSTGPATGARLLFSNKSDANIKCSILEEKLCSLEAELSLGKIGMQVLEDAVCNWQKSPNLYKAFRG